MGAGLTKVLPNLFLIENGEATTEANIKKAKVAYMLASGLSSPKNEYNWKNLDLTTSNRQSRIIDLKAGAKFIQQARALKQNVGVIYEQNNPSAITFLSAYFLILTGLPVHKTKDAVKKIKDKLEVPDTYDDELEAIRSSNTPKALREELLKGTETYPDDLLASDVKAIYQLAKLSAPTQAELNLESFRDYTTVTSPIPNSSGESNRYENDYSKSDPTKAVISSKAEPTSPGNQSNYGNGSITTTKRVSNGVKITYAISNESTEADKVDEYLKNTSEDIRSQQRRHVIITRALTKCDDD